MTVLVIANPHFRSFVCNFQETTADESPGKNEHRKQSWIIGIGGFIFVQGVVSCEIKNKIADVRDNLVIRTFCFDGSEGFFLPHRNIGT